MSKDTKDITVRISAIFQEVLPELKDTELDMGKKQGDFVGWDSFAHMELVGKIEQGLGVTLELDEVIALDCPRAFVDLVIKKKALS